MLRAEMRDHLAFLSTMKSKALEAREKKSG